VRKRDFKKVKATVSGKKSAQRNPRRKIITTPQSSEKSSDSDIVGDSDEDVDMSSLHEIDSN